MSKFIIVQTHQKISFYITIIVDDTPNMVYPICTKGKDVIKMLMQEGWEIKRITGSHYIMKKEGYRIVPVPYHSNELKTGLLKAISKQTGVKLP